MMEERASILGRKGEGEREREGRMDGWMVGVSDASTQEKTQEKEDASTQGKD